MSKRGYVYILASKPNGTLYVGVTSDPVRRIQQHKEGDGSSFTNRYGVHRLVYVEEHATMEEALRREQRVKRWRRKWKLALIREQNPAWEDRYEEMCENLATGGSLE